MSNFNFENRLEQKQVLLPSLILEMKLLAMNAIELEQFIKEKAEENPFIEYEENSEEMTRYFSSIYKSEISTSDILEKVSYQYESLFDFFQNQLSLYELSQKEKENALLLVPFLSNSGILQEKLSDISNKLDVSIYDLENGKIYLSMIDAKGYGSENIKEMILTQIWLSDDKDSEFLFETLFNHYDDILFKNFGKLHKAGYNNNQIEKIINLMNKIIQIPSSIINSYNNYIAPDAIIKVKDGKIVYRIIEPFKIYINKYQIVDSSDEIKKFLQEAKNLNNALKLRKSAFESFMKYFVILQQNFFLKGEKYLTPISQKEFASKIDISESTISRIVNNKYIDTPYGIYPLKFFLSASYYKKSGKESNKNIQSRNQVINAIKEIISNEQKDNPYSDEEIV
ncbi:MAG: hypothetical protein ACK4YF_00115, partial [Exilispira sp.]